MYAFNTKPKIVDKYYGSYLILRYLFTIVNSIQKKEKKNVISNILVHKMVKYLQLYVSMPICVVTK